jgi:hypothetical protein
MDPDDGGRNLLRNVHNYLQIDTATFSRMFNVHACSGVGRVFFVFVWGRGTQGRIITIAAPNKNYGL